MATIAVHLLLRWAFSAVGAARLYPAVLAMFGWLPEDTEALDGAGLKLKADHTAEQVGAEAFSGASKQLKQSMHAIERVRSDVAKALALGIDAGKLSVSLKPFTVEALGRTPRQNLAWAENAGSLLAPLDAVLKPYLAGKSASQLVSDAWADLSEKLSDAEALKRAVPNYRQRVKESKANVLPRLRTLRKVASLAFARDPATRRLFGLRPVRMAKEEPANDEPAKAKSDAA